MALIAPLDQFMSISSAVMFPTFSLCVTARSISLNSGPKAEEHFSSPSPKYCASRVTLNAHFASTALLLGVGVATVASVVLVAGTVVLGCGGSDVSHKSELDSVFSNCGDSLATLPCFGVPGRNSDSFFAEGISKGWKVEKIRNDKVNTSTTMSNRMDRLSKNMFWWRRQRRY
jgi:hypothetical protein